MNGYFFPVVKHGHNTVDQLAEAMKRFREVLGVAPGLIKADIDSAFRRIPINEDHRWACGVAFKKDGQVWYQSSVARVFSL